jgi:hypothetical protein
MSRLHVEATRWRGGPETGFGEPTSLSREAQCRKGQADPFIGKRGDSSVPILRTAPEFQRTECLTARKCQRDPTSAGRTALVGDLSTQG